MKEEEETEIPDLVEVVDLGEGEGSEIEMIITSQVEVLIDTIVLEMIGEIKEEVEVVIGLVVEIEIITSANVMVDIGTGKTVTEVIEIWVLNETGTLIVIEKTGIVTGMIKIATAETETEDVIGIVSASLDGAEMRDLMSPMHLAFL
jgi:hypothetical protein